MTVFKVVEQIETLSSSMKSTGLAWVDAFAASTWFTDRAQADGVAQARKAETGRETAVMSFEAVEFRSRE